jgi:ATP-dependent DNA helicase RecQ
MESLGHDQLPTFGVGDDLSADEWRGVIRQLVARGVLHPDPTAMGALQLTEAANPILKGTATVELRRTLPKTPADRAKRSSRSAGPAANVSSEDQALFEALRAVRKELAEADGVPAFVVLADKALREIASTRPRTLEELLEVNGIGPVKAERYGSQFLAVVADE